MRYGGRLPAASELTHRHVLLWFAIPDILPRQIWQATTYDVRLLPVRNIDAFDRGTLESAGDCAWKRASPEGLFGIRNVLFYRELLKVGRKRSSSRAFLLVSFIRPSPLTITVHAVRPPLFASPGHPQRIHIVL
jgi:hypothetical protein